MPTGKKKAAPEKVEKDYADEEQGILPDETEDELETEMKTGAKDEDIYDKLFGLWDVHFSTIGKSSQELLHLDGLKKDDADRLTSFLLEKIRHHNP